VLAAQHNDVGEQGKLYIDQIFQIEYAKARLEELNLIITNGQQKIATDTSKIDFLHEQGAISAQEQNRQLAAAYGEQIASIRRILPELQIYAAMTQDPRNVQAVREMEVELQRLAVQQAEVSNLALKLAHTARQGLEQTLGDLFNELFKEGRTIKTALAEVALGVLKAMNEVLAPQIAQTIVAAMNESFGTLGESAAGAFVKSFARVIGRGLQAAFDAVLAPILSAVGSGVSAVLGPIFGSRGGAGDIATNPPALEALSTTPRAVSLSRAFSAPMVPAIAQSESSLIAQMAYMTSRANPAIVVRT
jgi:hypothetical protein